MGEWKGMWPGKGGDQFWSDRRLGTSQGFTIPRLPSPGMNSLPF